MSQLSCAALFDGFGTKTDGAASRCVVLSPAELNVMPCEFPALFAPAWLAVVAVLPAFAVVSARATADMKIAVAKKIA
ncbi:hypothetical protein [Caballeronia sp. dw_19]|uniref:hypothetical protein n=1 Tax=Caballeronia sp. dw_19 TaxID=2719791 RepID=UPI001BCBA1EC|nr:hypothetical protein [Caballeronia sp. dw_19]